MVGAQRGLSILAAVAALAVTQAPVGTNGSGVAVSRADPRSVYEPSQKEYYLAQEMVDVLRPGLKMTINGVTNIAPGQKPVVDFTITDDFGNPLDRTGATTPGVVTARFTVAVWDGLYYTNLIVASGNPSRDTNGTWQSVSDGRYKYTFAAALPTFDPTMPATLFGGARRMLTDLLGKDYFVNTFKDLVPATGAAATTWGATTTAMCNQCHDPLAGHGGNYTEAKTCAICHNPNNMVGQIPGSGGEPPEDRGKYNGQVFWHKLHAGLDPEIVAVTYPQPIRPGGATFNGQRCATCHDPKAPMGWTWFTYPTRAACGACHADVDFATGANHSPQNLAMANDDACADCHAPVGDVEYDASVINSHILPSESAQLQGLNVAILSATNTGAGQKPTVTFKITDNKGNFIKPNATGLTISLLLGGNTKDYTSSNAGAQPISQSATGAAYDPATGIATYTFTTAIPADATGTWTISAQSRRTVNLVKGVGGTIAYTEGAVNPIYDVSVDGSDVVARRVVVDLAKCNACHYRLATTFSHGGQRIAIQFCVICHNPNANDGGRRPADGSANPPESISFQRMIHRIHTGEELTQDYTVYGFTGPSNFNEVTYPGDRRDCVRCHTSMATTNLPPPEGTLNVVTLRDYFSPRGPGTAACTGCHDNQDVAAHAYLNTTTFPDSTQPTEACGTCHGPNSDWSPAKVHAR
ncbi:MAG TPA: OmcA/MtrC family decaheme c-type cytochrome [Thermoanaerobaculia bacterium]|nr:OmcA/MtrC family decaheme c-type cytochrome [Thermoanaerobaculia bacterium]